MAEAARHVVLPFMKLLQEFNANQYASGVVELFKTEHRLHSGFDAAMILLHDIVEVLAAAYLYRVLPAEVELIPHAHPTQCCMAGLKPVQSDGSWLTVA